MHTKLSEEVEYELPIGDDLVNMNQFIGKEITFTTNINCYYILCNLSIHYWKITVSTLQS